MTAIKAFGMAAMAFHVPLWTGMASQANAAWAPAAAAGLMAALAVTAAGAMAYDFAGERQRQRTGDRRE